MVTKASLYVLINGAESAVNSNNTQHIHYFALMNQLPVPKTKVFLENQEKFRSLKQVINFVSNNPKAY